jgi:hypothetical protein
MGVRFASVDDVEHALREGEYLPDVFSAGHTLASLEALGEELRALG